MRSIRVPDCCLGESKLSNRHILTDVYLILDEKDQPLWHENLFLIDIAKRFSLNTCKAYADDLLSFSRMSRNLGGWQNINERHLTGYIVGDLIQGRALSESSVIRHTITIKTFFNWTAKKGYLISIPDFNWDYRNYFTGKLNDTNSYKPHQHSHHSSYIDKERYEHILSHVNRNSSFAQTRDLICIRLGYEAGTRAHEVLNINHQAIIKHIEKSKKDNNGLWSSTFSPLVGKGGKIREILIPPDLCESIYIFVKKNLSTFTSENTQLICQKDGSLIFNKKHASYVFTQALIKANISRKGHQGYHALRKSFGTNLVNDCYKDGVDPWVVVPRRMGHSSVDTTLKYIHFEALLHGRSKILEELRMNKFRGLKHAR